jgi:DNA-binding response OmpR family regulator
MKEEKLRNEQLAKIVAIDDDFEILKLEKRALERVGHEVEIISKINQETIKKARLADLILLDIMMPGEDGLSWCESVRNQVDIPILFVTAKTGEEDLIKGLSVGGDDYILKPFSIEVLRARVSAHLRRENREKCNVIRKGEFVLDLSLRELRYQEQVILLTKAEYDINEYLMKQAGQVFSKLQIYEAVFGYEGESDTSVIVEHIKNIRKKFREYQENPIETVWGVGYRWKK